MRVLVQTAMSTSPRFKKLEINLDYGNSSYLTLLIFIQYFFVVVIFFCITIVVFNCLFFITNLRFMP